MKSKTLTVICLMSLLAVWAISPAQGARIKELAAIKGIRGNQLTGYGLVVGLDGTGDKSGTRFTVQSLVNMLERMGINVDKSLVRVKNVAAVMVTATLPPFARIGSRIDVVVSSIGDAQSLVGGTLLLTPLRGPDGKIYAIAQGPVSVGGVGASGASGSSVTKNHLLAARIAGGATVEREVSVNLLNKKMLTLTLFNPDFTTALRVSEAINSALGKAVCTAVDSGTLRLRVPDEFNGKIPRLLAKVESLQVEPDAVAKVVVNEKTGTVVIGQRVRISTVAISHGNLSITIKESFNVSQPAPFSRGGQTVVTPETDIEIKESEHKLMVVQSGSTIADLVKALNAIGVSPRDLISIFQSIKAAGALQAELEII
ncbi:MAG: flagellar basal body P-ring protein FlgI [Deltaproteobacteria bacterium]|nr:flagellar basal body P-ring protein FlgI [Deltaproteobacteria bacterium]